MRTILKTFESPDKNYKLQLQKRSSLIDIANGTPNDDFYLLITNKSLLPIIRNLLRKKVKIGQSFYEPSAEAFLNPYGNVIKDIEIKPKEKHIDVTLLRKFYGNTRIPNFEETKEISY